MAKALIIDDDPEYSDMLRQQLSALDNEVACCRTLEGGLAALADFRPELVFLDVVLPDGNGLEQIHALKTAPSLPEIIIVTGLGDEEGAEMAVRAGAWDYWQKGRSLAGIEPIIQHALGFRAQRLTSSHRRVLDLEGLVAESQAMAACLDLVAQASDSEVPVLLRGETGTGKEVAARLIHKNGLRANKPFVIFDCASLTETLVESSFFGHERGAFTGASSARTGVFRQAHEGTLFLDEIGELSLGVQKALLRVLQEKRFRPVGADHEVPSDFRLLAATNRDLDAMVRNGTFRQDLYFRLRSLEIMLPPLRARGQDVLRIARDTAEEICARLAVPCKALSPEMAEVLVQYPWPGNVRELRQAIDCAVALAGDSPVLEPIHLPVQIRVELARASVKPELNLRRCEPPSGGYRTLASVRDAAVSGYLAQLLRDTRGDVEAACKLADISRSRFYELLKLHGLGKGTKIRSPQRDEAIDPAWRYS